jgi:hypothetical protein
MRLAGIARALRLPTGVWPVAVLVGAIVFIAFAT